MIIKVKLMILRKPIFFRAPPSYVPTIAIPDKIDIYCLKFKHADPKTLYYEDYLNYINP